MRTIILFVFLVLISSCKETPDKKNKNTEDNYAELQLLSREAASNFANIALNCVHREYPNKLSHVMNDSSEVMSPKTLHPAFYGCFDWHSSVHGHWMLVKLLKDFPALPEADRIREALNINLSANNIETELAYLGQAGRRSFERTYGWAWLLKLANELYDWDDAQGKEWSRNLQPLARAIEQRYIDFLPRQEFPIRRGVHPNTAFGLSFALDYARKTGREELEQLILVRAKDYYLTDINSAASWEPDGDDFLSPSLMEAGLMSRVLNEDEYHKWLDAFLPALSRGKPASLVNPVNVSDRSDPKIVHLDGLNLSRAWCMYNIAKALPEYHQAVPVLLNSAEKHANATLPHISSGNYEGEHWLASFAVYMYDCQKMELY